MYITCILSFLSICIYIWRNICTNIGQISFSSTQPDCSVLWRKSLLYFLSSILLRKITRVGDIKKYFFQVILWDDTGYTSVLHKMKIKTQFGEIPIFGAWWGRILTSVLHEASKSFSTEYSSFALRSLKMGELY